MDEQLHNAFFYVPLSTPAYILATNKELGLSEAHSIHMLGRRMLLRDLYRRDAQRV